MGKSYDGQPLRSRQDLRKRPGFPPLLSVRYALKPEYDRFVALAGIADNMLDQELVGNRAMHCSVAFASLSTAKWRPKAP